VEIEGGVRVAILSDDGVVDGPKCFRIGTIRELAELEPVRPRLGPRGIVMPRFA
jgi:hypothetical protein